MHIFVITSTLKPKIGIIDNETRYSQTLNTIQSIRNKVKDAVILLVDSSPEPLEQEKIDNLKSKTDYFITLFNHALAVELANSGLKSQAECYIMIIALDVIRNLALKDVNRVFKITGRAELTDNFHVEDYDNPEMQGKYVFKTPVTSWMTSQLKLVDTRLWSFDYPMLDETEKLIRQTYEECMSKPQFDLEHTYYRLLDKSKLFEKDVIGLKCQLASCGTIINE